MDPSEAGLMLLPMPMPPSIAPGEVAASPVEPWLVLPLMPSMNARGEGAMTPSAI